MQQIESKACFGGTQQVWEHTSSVLNCTMRFGVYLPPQAATAPCPVLYFLSGLTCTEQNLITKAGAQRYCADAGVILVAPDTSPRGDDVADDPGWDMGKGAGFYLNATQSPWATHYRMYDYIVDELPALITGQFPATAARSITGHSMGGHGALVIGLRNPGMYRSISALSPIVAPSQVPWGKKAFGGYLGSDQSTWAQWDAVALIRNLAPDAPRTPLFIDQGSDDSFLAEQLRTALLAEACAATEHPVTVRMQPGYDHSFYFVSTFIGEHIAYHASALQAT